MVLSRKQSNQNSLPLLKKSHQQTNSYYQYSVKKTRKLSKKQSYSRQKQTVPIVNHNKRKSLVLRAKIPLPFIIPEETSKILQRIESIFMTCHGRRTKVKQKYSEDRHLEYSNYSFTVSFKLRGILMVCSW